MTRYWSQQDLSSYSIPALQELREPSHLSFDIHWFADSRGMMSVQVETYESRKTKSASCFWEFYGYYESVSDQCQGALIEKKCQQLSVNHHSFFNHLASNLRCLHLPFGNSTSQPWQLGKVSITPPTPIHSLSTFSVSVTEGTCNHLHQFPVKMIFNTDAKCREEN